MSAQPSAHAYTLPHIVCVIAARPNLTKMAPILAAPAPGARAEAAPACRE